MISWRNDYGSQNHQSMCLRRDCRCRLPGPYPGPDGGNSVGSRGGVAAPAALGDIPQNPRKVSKDIGTMRGQAASF